ncbi:MAG: purB [Chloroflexi bacterium]|nr:purB [Chloroflexota bacterium]
MIRRYTLPEMGSIWEESARFEHMLRVEIEVARAQVARAQVPADALAAIEARARVAVDRIAEIEATTDHDVIAFVSQVAETVGPEGRFLHLGLTSSDVLDTALALQLGAAGDLLIRDAERLVAALVARARTEAGTVMMGRTHSVHAEPTTFGLKLAGWAFEADRGRRRLAAAVDEIRTGKISGPVGTYSHLAPDLEAEVLGALGLRADPVSTQIVQRDRHAALLGAIAILGGSLERFATEIRNLAHTEIGEVMEPFQAGQKGSSAMPHKRNPILSERIAGIARVLRGYAQAGMENQALWHERDISHSSAERVILPDATILLDYALQKMTGLVAALVVRPERMRENIERGHGLHASSRVLVALVERGGMPREEAYAIVQRAALAAADERRPLRDLLAIEAAVARHLSLADLAPPRSCGRGHCPPDSARDGAGARPRRHAMTTATGSSYLRSGKVRDLYAIDDERLLLVASDRLSAFDVVLPRTVPDKGRVLTGLSRFWFAMTRDIVANHLLDTDPGAVPAGVVPHDVGADLRGRMILCRRARVLPIEVVVRGYLAGSGWKEYRAAGTVCGVPLPSGLCESDRLPEPILTPATKAEQGAHDENIDFETMVGAIVPLAGDKARAWALARRVREVGLALYARAATHCEAVGLILADTKFEMGLVGDELILVDEVLTPDSSRFWDAGAYDPGGPQASFDKQFVRDWLESQPWDKTAPGPELPADVVAGTRARYVEAYERITGASFARYLEEDLIAP